MEQYFKEKAVTRVNGVKKQEKTQKYTSISSNLASIIQQFKQNSQNEYEKNIGCLNDSAKKQYWMEKHYSLEQEEDLEF